MKNLHLVLSSILIIVIAVVYGYSPSVLLPQILNIRVEGTDIKHVFRAIMGLYLGMSALWIAGILKPLYWQAATITKYCFYDRAGCRKVN
ncbi:MAG: DUF4345 domain-containing protein [Bacteroidota bacterium]